VLVRGGGATAIGAQVDTGRKEKSVELSLAVFLFFPLFFGEYCRLKRIGNIEMEFNLMLSIHTDFLYTHNS